MSSVKDKKTAKEYVGHKFGRLTIVEYLGTNKNDSIVKAECECGKVKDYLFKHIKAGKTLSCGCFKVDTHTKHGLYKHPLNTVYEDMMDRCYNPNSKHYDRYGGRGVTVSIRWRGNFKAFYDWAIDKWKPGLELDKDIRSDKKVGDFYCPEICCFVTHKENMRHTNMNVFIEYKGETLCVAEWCERLGLSRSCYNGRIARGWPIEKIFTTANKKK
jgi:hypothetical protein